MTAMREAVARKRKKLKAKPRPLRFRKNDPTHNLQAAVQHFVAANGGNAVVIGGGQVEWWPGDELRFKVAVECTGRRPTEAARTSAPPSATAREDEKGE